MGGVSMEWKEVRLGDACELIPGYAFKSKDFGNFPTKVIKIGDINPPIVNYESEIGIDLSSYDINKISKYIVKYDDFVLAMTGATIGKVGRYIAYNDSYLNQRVLLFKPNQNFDSKYIYYTVCSSSFSKYVINHIDSESAQPNISANTISKYQFYIPVIKEDQRRIAAILSSLDRKIELNNKINAQLEEMAQALFKYWFVDFGPFKDGKFVESELGMIPEGWRAGRLEEICSIVGGSTPSKARSDYYTDYGIAWLTPKDLSVTKAKFTAKGETDITEDGYKSTSTKLMPRGSVLFTSRAPIGYITIAKNDICTNQGFKSLVPNYAGTAFLYCYLKEMTPTIENKATGSTFKEASGSLMKSLSVLIPPKEILNMFEDKSSSIFNKQENIEQENLHLASLRDTLLPRLMSGEIEL